MALYAQNRPDQAAGWRAPPLLWQDFINNNAQPVQVFRFDSRGNQTGDAFEAQAAGLPVWEILFADDQLPYERMPIAPAANQSP